MNEAESSGAAAGGLPAEQPGDPSLSPNGCLFRPVVLVIMDGWGVAPDGPGNAISLARTPSFDHLVATYPHGTLEASGPAVGLPPGQMGNSEVGHLNIGAGRVVYQDLTRISKAIEDGSFFANRVLKQAFAKAVGRGSTLHLLGLVSDGGVHSDMTHLEACVEMARREGAANVVVHAFLDGRDTPPKSASGYVAQIAAFMKQVGVGRFGTLSGRYYAMDRDTRWERTKLAYDALVHGDGLYAPSAAAAVAAAYERGETDEFVRPTVIVGDGSALPVADHAAVDPAQLIKDGDVCLFFNFRPDRVRQLTRALFEKQFDLFDRGSHPPRIDVVTMTEYKKEFALPVAFTAEHPRHVLAEVLAEHGLHQLHIAETEKYAHVTFFFNGGVEKEVPGETRILIPSPRDVPTYDKKPQMSAVEVTDELLRQLASGEFAFVVVNYANADMVGHSGVLAAAIAAVEVVDECLGRVVEATVRLGGVCLVTADHGNSDNLLEPDGSPNTAHSTNPVPFVATVPAVMVRQGGVLADLAPTALHLLGIAPPAEMTGRDLLVEASATPGASRPS